nr:Chain C, Agr autoinducing peptide [synthetic construct]3QG6_D Chain D, Agr autoinducing peptide [synthetic construct]
YSTCYFIM